MTNDELALECKRREIEAIEMKRSTNVSRDYFAGKVAAYADIWEFVVSDGKRLLDYDDANERWSKRVAEKREEKRDKS